MSCSTPTARRHFNKAMEQVPPDTRKVQDSTGIQYEILWVEIPEHQWESRPRRAEDLQDLYIRHKDWFVLRKNQKRSRPIDALESRGYDAAHLEWQFLSQV
jgi:hypothetical protein